jgi:2-iminobutanoate/2-iminopropanoate deaminase
LARALSCNGAIGQEITMSRTVITTPDAPKSPSYAQAVRAGGLIFVSGTPPQDPATGKLVEGPVQAQLDQCLRNISAILQAAGSSLAKAVSATLILADEEDFAAANSEWLKWFPTDPPARQGAKLPVRIPGLKVSVAMIAEA